jgi:hypothetical protein
MSDVTVVATDASREVSVPSRHGWFLRSSWQIRKMAFLLPNKSRLLYGSWSQAPMQSLRLIRYDD